MTATVPVRHLTLAEVLDLARHACLAQDQPVELRAPGLLESAVHRPRALGAPPSGSWGSSGPRPTRTRTSRPPRCSNAIATNHPLVDGNKRTAWLAAATFLAVNGVDLGEVDQDLAYGLVVDVAAGHETDVARIADRLRALLRPPV
ncbi:Fic family protein [Streptomyces sp. NPDC048357]|uniref:type II toxin-antitoxin system death-on-curing family toxin n=1 Tax=Streptomyces sp. NPDC048357 TaxID=3154719 RepID=UPI00344A919C